MTEIALYDLDRTITKKPTYAYFLLHAAWRHAPWRILLLPAVILTSILFLFRILSRARLKELNQAIMIGGAIPPAKLAAIAESFADATLADNVYPQAIARIEADRAAGRRLVIASASYAFYVVPIARRLGFDDVIATGSKTGPEGNIVARIDGRNCYGEAKLGMVGQWLAAQDSDRSGAKVRFYSDSESDLPVFEWSDEPIVTNPTAKMRRIAERRNWPIVSWG